MVLAQGTDVRFDRVPNRRDAESGKSCYGPGGSERSSAGTATLAVRAASESAVNSVAVTGASMPPGGTVTITCASSSS